MRNNQKLLDYIKQGWINCVVDKRQNYDNDDLPVVAPFTPPCLKGLFRTLFYWDTYY